ncbi:DUF5681 domain-containing protein [Erythrobacter sp. sf7]|uniref:DUF5681 domain-containing protein n=1 Tax=Erythrobacter fulvus TaxID=2987523 RepID=A0ABT5JUG6_9SPHN|nr:DUF5681 domain-containing protein [Erythrobacter fulvus]MDC8755187.1 DUF5681 domain-containing protein [Erythrobacter fulvus]
MSEPEPVGYGQPPSKTRFRKGQSGNPRGRPKRSRREIPYDAVLGQMVTIREEGRERRVTAAEAFLLQLTQKGLAGDSAAARASLEAIETARAARTDTYIGPTRLVWKAVDSGMDAIIDTLGIAQLKYPTDEVRVRWELNPWIVEAALARLGDRQLTFEEQREVWDATRTPHKVRWPEWWGYFGE